MPDAMTSVSELPESTRIVKTDRPGESGPEAVFAGMERSPETDTLPLPAEHPVPSLPVQTSSPHREVVFRALAALALLPIALGLCVWLTLCCADFLQLERASYEASSAWLLFALHVSLGCLFPPALLAGFTRLLAQQGRAMAPSVLLRESSRAALLSYALFVVLFFFCAWIFKLFLPTFHPVYIPALLSRIQALVCCLLLWISWSIAAFLLPPAIRHTPPPRSMLIFLVLSWTLALWGLFASPLSPYADGSGTPGGTFGHPLDFFLLAASSWLLFRRGLRSMRVIFTALCVTGPIAGLAWLPLDLPLSDAVFALSRALLALAACILLWFPASRAWLMK